MATLVNHTCKSLFIKLTPASVIYGAFISQGNIPLVIEIFLLLLKPGCNWSESKETITS